MSVVEKGQNWKNNVAVSSHFLKGLWKDAGNVLTIDRPSDDLFRLYIVAVLDQSCVEFAE